MKYLQLEISINMGIILYFIAIILYIPLTVINAILVLFKYGWKFKTINDFFYETAVDIDRFANRNFRTLWNETLRKEGGYKFGDERETVSSALGKNKRDNTITKTGKILCSILDFLDKNHCLKSIKEL
jgi:hypothetical protein